MSVSSKASLSLKDGKQWKEIWKDSKRDNGHEKARVIVSATFSPIASKSFSFD